MSSTIAEAMALVEEQDRQATCCVQRWVDGLTKDDQDEFHQVVKSGASVAKLHRGLLTLDEIAPSFSLTALRDHVRQVCKCHR